MRHRIIIIYFSLLAGSLSIFPVMASTAALAEFQWQKRPLLIFSPEEQNAKLKQMMGQIEINRCLLADRDMVIGIFPATGTSRLNTITLSTDQAASIREYYDIQSDAFVVLLIGKDGYEKYRSEQPPELADIFGLIDGMPMRQQEMTSNRLDCQNL